MSWRNQMGIFIEPITNTDIYKGGCNKPSSSSSRGGILPYHRTTSTTYSVQHAHTAKVRMLAWGREYLGRDADKKLFSDSFLRTDYIPQQNPPSPSQTKQRRRLSIRCPSQGDHPLPPF